MLKRSLLVLFFAFITPNAFSQEEEFISLFIYNFIRYFEWPENRRTGDFVIEIMGHESVARKLKEITTNRNIGNQRIVVRYITSPDEMGSPHIIMVGHWHSRHMQRVLSKIGAVPTLIISDREGMTREGSAINFVIRDGTIKFELNRLNATKYGLKVHSRLENMAIVVD